MDTVTTYKYANPQDHRIHRYIHADAVIERIPGAGAGKDIAKGDANGDGRGDGWGNGGLDATKICDDLRASQDRQDWDSFTVSMTVIIGTCLCLLMAIIVKEFGGN